MLIRKVSSPQLDFKYHSRAYQKQAVAVRKHLERNRKDKDSKFRLILIESRIHRLSRYYKANGTSRTLDLYRNGASH